MTLEQLLEVASLFLAIGIGISWLMTRYGHTALRAFDRMLPPRYLKRTAIRRRSTRSEDTP
tara:strand:- start:12356 stop:12538 length:183 start_codon:yes stop_codon:yes gene_type:complete